jgi:hypothetical protein
VPSDLVIAVVSRILPGDIVQKLVLLAIFVLGCAGVAALLDREPVLARLAGGVFYAWNPYVGERLIIGQWALLLGYASLPWVLRAVVTPADAPWRWTGRLCLALLPAVIGGFEAMTLAALVLVPAALVTRSGRRIAIAFAVLAAGSLPWLIPSLQHAVYVDPASVAAFAARADTPFGSIGSVLMLGGAWNAQTVPKSYGGAWSAVWLALVIAALAGYLALARRDRRWPGLGIAAVVSLLIACVGVTEVGREALRSLISAWPGAGVLRDGQQFVAPLALAEAAGFGVAVSWVMNPRAFRAAERGPAREAEPDRSQPEPDQAQPEPAGGPGRPAGSDRPGVALAVLALLGPVLLLPGLAGGAAGRLQAAQYPATWLAAARMIDASPARGAVLLLPWETYRTPSWNHGEVVFDPWTRLLSRPVIFNDGTRVGGVALAPDDPRARQLDGDIRGDGPLTAPLEAAGVRFVVDDPGRPGQETAASRLPGAVVLVNQPGLTVYRLPG